MNNSKIKTSQLEIQEAALARAMEQQEKLRQSIKEKKLRYERAKRLYEKRLAEQARRDDAHCKIKMGGILWREIKKRYPEMEIMDVNFIALSRAFEQEKIGSYFAQIAALNTSDSEEDSSNA